MASDRIDPALFFYVGRAQQKQKPEKKHKICRIAQNLRQKNSKSDKIEWNRCFVLNASCFLLERAARERYTESRTEDNKRKDELFRGFLLARRTKKKEEKENEH